MKKLASTILLTLCTLILAPHQSFAADTSPRVTISPFLREVRIAPEEGTKQFDVEINNDSTLTQSFTLSTLDFGTLDDSGGIVFAGSNASSLIKKYGLANWLQLSTNSLTIDAGKSARVVATIINDVTLAPGGHYAAIVAAVKAPDTTGSNQVSVDQKLSSLIFAGKTGGEKYDLRLDSIDAKHGRFALPSSVTLRFYNPGNIHVVPRGTVKLLSPSGDVISQGVINEASSFILPETSRQLQVDLRGIGKSWLWPSAYRVQVDYRYDGLETFARKEQRIYVINLPGIIVILVLLSLLIWLGITLKLFKKLGPFVRTKRRSKK